MHIDMMYFIEELPAFALEGMISEDAVAEIKKALFAFLYRRNHLTPARALDAINEKLVEIKEIVDRAQLDASN